MESWRHVFREGVVPSLGNDELAALRKALEEDDNALLQGATTSPPPLHYVQDWPVEAACPLAYVGWKGKGLNIVAAVEEAFAQLCFDCDERLTEPEAVRWFLNWWDESPRNAARRQLLKEVNLVLKQREETEKNVTHETSADAERP